MAFELTNLQALAWICVLILIVVICLTLAVIIVAALVKVLMDIVFKNKWPGDG